MTFQEYLNQDNPQRAISVNIINADCAHISVLNRKDTRAIITLEISSKCYNYHLSQQDNLLRVMDGDGNPTRISCFIWQGETEHWYGQNTFNTFNSLMFGAIKNQSNRVWSLAQQAYGNSKITFMQLGKVQQELRDRGFFISGAK